MRPGHLGIVQALEKNGRRKTLTHQWHDAYRHARTPAHHLDPRSKLFVGTLFVATVLFTREWGILQKLGYPALLTVVLFLTGLPFATVVKRTLSILPFALLMLISAVVSKLSLQRLQESSMTSVLSVPALAFTPLTTPLLNLLT